MNLFLRIFVSVACFGFVAFTWLSPEVPYHRSLATTAAILFCTAVFILPAIRNFNPALRRKPLLRWLTLGLLSFECVACTGIGAGISGQMPPSTAVARVDGESQPVLIATRDLTRAETSPGTEIWGLYNVGNVARATQQIAESGK